MDLKSFWQIIDATVSDDQDAQLTALTEALGKLAPEDIAAFQRIYDENLDRAFRWDLWGAAYTLNDGCSDDGFDYFCDWLISRGQAVFEAALTDPESLAGSVLVAGEDFDTEFENLRYIAGEVYEDKTGNEMARAPSRVAEPAGEPFDEATVHERFPRLAEIAANRPEWDPFGTDPETKALIARGKPLFTEENRQSFDTRLAGMVGRKLAGSGAIHNHVALILEPDAETIEARCWSIELADGRVLHAAKYVYDWGDAGIPDEVLAYMKAQPGFDSNEPTPNDDLASALLGVVETPKMDDEVGQLTNYALKSWASEPVIASAERIAPASIRFTFDGAPDCVALTMHGCDKNGSGDVHGILLQAEGETLCLSRHGVERQLPNTLWGW